MTPERWQKVRELFHAVVELDDDERASYLDQACSGDPSLREDVDLLISSHGQAKSFLETPVLAGEDPSVSGPQGSTCQQAEARGLIAGQRLGRYQVVEKIGAGGMGVVYRARDEHLDRDVALKVLPAGTLADERTRERFRNEALALSRLSHPHIATVYDFDWQEGTDFLVIEWVPGATLAEKLAAGLLPEKEAARLGIQTASALEEAHEHGVVHCDLKPGNVMVTPKGQVKVLDFGLAKLLRPAGEAAPIDTLKTGQNFAGTPPYMAPEQLRGERPDARTDIWALGAVLYEMVADSRPFPQASGPQLTAAILTEQPRPPSSLNRRISPALENVILKALDKEPENRYQSAKELAVDLRRLATPSSIPAARLTARSRGVRRAALLSVLAAVLLLVIAAILNLGGWRDRLLGRETRVRVHSLAVLPLENLSGDASQEYFADGMTEAVITDLGKIAELQVISRTSAMHYKGTRKTLPEIARELHVDALVEGAVLRSGNRVRITAQLVEASTDRHLWAESYEHDLSDVLALQSQVAQAIVKEIEIKLTSPIRARLASARPVNPQAYEAYLMGSFYRDKMTRDASMKSREYLEQAIRLDPNCAPAYAGLATSLTLLLAQSGEMPREVAPKAREAAAKALEIDETLAEAHISMGIVKLFFDWDWPGAEKELTRAIELNPSDAHGHYMQARYLDFMGRFDEAIAEIQQARRLDPLSVRISWATGSVFNNARRPDEAIEQERKTIEMDPNFASAHLTLGYSYLQKSMFPEAVAEFEKGMILDEDAEFVAELRRAYDKGGITGYNRKRLGQLKKLSKQMYVDPYRIAEAYEAVGENDEAFNWLELAYNNHSTQMVRLKMDHHDSLRSDPRFAAMLRRMAFPP